MIVHRLGETFTGKITKRPSSSIKSPYVADVSIKIGNTKQSFLAHTPSLGCSGLCEAPNRVVMTPTPGNKCDYRVQLAKDNNVYVAINPKIGESIVHKLLRTNNFYNLDVLEYKPEVTILNSRFDFAGKCSSGDFIVEVKSVPLKYDKHTAYFPEGYRKKKGDPISPRALKHIQELQQIKQNNTNTRCILCFIINRHDIKEFKINENDPIYHKAVQSAWLHGVEIYAQSIIWSKKVGRISHKIIPIILFNNYGPYQL